MDCLHGLSKGALALRDKVANAPPTYKRLAFAVALILALGALTTLALGGSRWGALEGLWEFKFLEHLTSLELKIMVVAGALGAVFFPYVGIRALLLKNVYARNSTKGTFRKSTHFGPGAYKKRFDLSLKNALLIPDALVEQLSLKCPFSKDPRFNIDDTHAVLYMPNQVPHSSKELTDYLTVLEKTPALLNDEDNCTTLVRLANEDPRLTIAGCAQSIVDYELTVKEAREQLSKLKSAAEKPCDGFFTLKRFAELSKTSIAKLPKDCEETFEAPYWYLITRSATDCEKIEELEDRGYRLPTIFELILATAAEEQLFSSLLSSKYIYCHRTYNDATATENPPKALAAEYTDAGWTLLDTSECSETPQIVGVKSFQASYMQHPRLKPSSQGAPTDQTPPLSKHQEQ